jgi:hypothetical protein
MKHEVCFCFDIKDGKPMYKVVRTDLYYLVPISDSILHAVFQDGKRLRVCNAENILWITQPLTKTVSCMQEEDLAYA